MRPHGLRKRLTNWIIILFLFFVAAYIIQTLIARHVAKNRIVDSVSESVTQTAAQVSFTFEKAYSLGLVLSSNETIRKLVNYRSSMPWIPYDEVILIRDVQSQISRLSQYNSDIDSIYLFCEDKKQLILSHPDFYGKHFFYEFGWIRAAQDALPSKMRTISPSSAWVSGFQDTYLTESDFVSIIFRLDRISTGDEDEIRSVSYLGVNLDAAFLYQSLNGLELTRGAQAYLVDSTGRILASKDPGDIGTDVAKRLPRGLTEDAFREQSTVHHRGMLLFYASVSVPSWADVGNGVLLAVPQREFFSSQRWSFVFPFVGIMFLAAGLFVGASRLVRFHVSAPIEVLVEAMKRAEEGVFEEPLVENRHDEFGFLYHSYNSMIARISDLINELYQERVLKREIELQYLQNQMNPHFLYNTLDTINWLAKQHGVDDISRIVTSLSQLYRSTFNKGQDFILVRDAVERARSFLYIEQYRYGALETFEINVDEEAMETEILNLIIQPLVENAVVHGIGEQGPLGTVAIRGEVVPPLIRFTVSDSGCGIPAEKLDIIRRSIRNTRGSEASSLRNVHRRIQLHYGDAYGLSFASEVGVGTAVTIELPIRRAEQEP